MPRAIATATISFGLVSIPVKLFSASQTSESVAFNLLHKGCGSRLKQHYVCQKEDVRVERDEMIKGYEVSRGQYVTFTEEELKAIEEKATQSIEVQEFVPSKAVDPIYFDKAFYLGPDKGGARGYRLLSKAMEETGRWAVARYAARGKQYLVIVRPMGKGLVLQQLHYANEVRPLAELEIEDVDVKENELKLAILLSDQVATEEFHPENYKNDGRSRLQEIIDRKIQGEEISSILEEEPRGQVIDLMEALKASLSQGSLSTKSAKSRVSISAERKPAKRSPASAPARPAVRSAKKAAKR
ncbi:MAG TPA: Ku protein [Thermoanaerobaculia bacterium]